MLTSWIASKKRKSRNFFSLRYNCSLLQLRHSAACIVCSLQILLPMLISPSVLGLLREAADFAPSATRCNSCAVFIFFRGPPSTITIFFISLCFYSESFKMYTIPKVQIIDEDKISGQNYLLNIWQMEDFFVLLTS